LSSRREALTALSTSWQAPLLVTPQTLDPSIARDWFDRFESAGVDGLILKPLDSPYAPGQRAQFKIKHRRTADVVVAGWRPHARPGADGRDVVGSLLLGLHDDAGRLQYVGVASAFPAARRAELVDLLAPYEVGADAPHPWRGAGPGRVPGEVNRWNAARRAGEPAWHALRPELVAEVTYDQLEGDRLRHVAGFSRWRPDRDASTCGYDQLEVPPASTISGLLPLGR
ncbi:MAG: ATP dependent DNA ligase, partial [Candidatus Nanopelagicales bacterium]